MSILEIVQLVIIVLAILAVSIYMIVMAIKNKWVSKLYQTLKEAIKKAEESGKTGEEKKEYVMATLENKCIELGIPYKLLKSLLSKLIDSIVDNYNVIAK